MIHFFCAFMAEAQPIKDHFRIHQKETTSLFQCFSDKNRQYSLTITGAGKLNAAAGAAFAQSHFGIKKSAICLNVGIAGHKDLATGEAVFIDKITQTDAQCWYPQILFSTRLKRLTCKTVDTPSLDYTDDVFDMELSALYDIWMRFGISELCHSIKIISDNARQNFKQFDIRQSTNLIANNVTVIDTVLNELVVLQEDYINSTQVPLQFERCLQQFHFTQSQQIQLKNLLYRWQSFKPDASVEELFARCNKSKDLLAQMQTSLHDCVGFDV